MYKMSWQFEKGAMTYYLFCQSYTYQLLYVIRYQLRCWYERFMLWKWRWKSLLSSSWLWRIFETTQSSKIYLVVKMWQLNSYYHLNYPFFFQIKKNNCDWTSIARWIKVDLCGAEIFTWTRTMSTLVAIYQRLDFSLKKKIDHQNVTTKFLVIILTLKIFFVFFRFWFSYDWNLVVI